jgi:hypothetical protein
MEYDKWLIRLFYILRANSWYIAQLGIGDTWLRGYIEGSLHP